MNATGSAGTGAGPRYVRAAVKAGAIQARPASAFHLRILSLVEMTNAIGMVTQSVSWCPHIVDRGHLGDAFITIHGPAAFRWTCADCYVEPARALGCGTCDRRPPPGLRLVVYADPPDVSGIVIAGQLCSRCRAGAI